MKKLLVLMVGLCLIAGTAVAKDAHKQQLIMAQENEGLFDDIAPPSMFGFAQAGTTWIGWVPPHGPNYGAGGVWDFDDGGTWPCPTEEHPGTAILHTEIFSRGKGHFVPLEYRPSAELPDDEYPLVLTTDRSLFHFHTGTMTRKVRGLNIFLGEELVAISPTDAEALGINDGDTVQVISRRGQVTAKASFGIRDDWREPIDRVIAVQGVNLVGTNKGVVDSLHHLRHRIHRVQALVRVHFAGAVAVTSNLPARTVDRLEAGLDFLDGLVTRQGAKAAQRLILVDQAPHFLGTLACQRVLDLHGTAQLDDVFGAV